MVATLDFRLRDALPHLRESGRLNVLIDLFLRVNVRNRCWPSMRLIAKDTGFGLEAVNEAKKWLVKHGAITLVSYGQRVDEERDLPRRQNVYQLTGVLRIDGKVYPYIYVSPTEISDSEISPVESKVFKESKTKQREKRKESAAPIGTDSLSGDNLIATGDALLANAFANDPDSVQATEATTEQANTPKAKKILPQPDASSARKPLQEAVAYGFPSIGYGGLNGRIGAFFSGTLKDDPKHRSWFQVQAKEQPASPQEIVALALWYSKHPDYAKSFAEKKGLPKTPEKLRERLDEFRGAKGYSKAMELAGPIFERLMRGEQVQTVHEMSAAATGPAESVQAYKPYDAKANSAYTRRVDPDETPDPDLALEGAYDQA